MKNRYDVSVQQGVKNKHLDKHLDAVRHTLAHLLAMAVLKKFPQAQLGIGPTIEHGFYYDFKLPRPLTPDDLKEFEKEMRALIAAKLPVRGEKITAPAAKKLFANQPFKFELIKDFVKERKHLTIYITGEIPQKKITNIINLGEINLSPPPSSPLLRKEGGAGGSFNQNSLNTQQSYFIDLCKGGHVKNTGEINPDAFTLTSVAGAYWKGSEKKTQLQRIYGLAFETKNELEEHIVMLGEAKKRDHKKLGIELDLFTFSDLVGSGLPLWTPKGTILRNLLDDAIWELRKKFGYQQVDIPHLAKKELYEKSGHWSKFSEELFKIITREGHEFALKPMNCPHHIQIFARAPHSYKDLPVRYANTTKVYRDEQTGELSGLARVRSITQDDAHVFCRESQVKEEFLNVWSIVESFYSKFGFKLKVRLSFHDPQTMKKYLGSPKLWKGAEETLKDIAQSKKADYVVAIGDAAFYGPKVDFLATDSLKREWQVATIQLDVNLPERFDLSCVNEKGEKERIVMIHAAIAGAIERLIAILIEHYAGAFPFWLAPVQAAFLPINDKNDRYIKKVGSALTEKNIRFETDRRNESIGKKIREAELQKIPFVLVVGDREAQQNAVALRKRGAGDQGAMSFEKAIEIMLSS